ncbi:hypothetical protein T4A_8599 [Trichinella pseudospiralis]|uniref:Uncharacterized protein n=1 Tax=Trichinella pseudospiralis TaxID=6337 RepID=A0A0V1DV66_TRIPS|nr:hypothetical protein T4A_8599 [Trichinella pseudospiralis]KRZ26225.1 hypothetical protein T4C_11610 [Trichinella pseudospiralis]
MKMRRDDLSLFASLTLELRKASTSFKSPRMLVLRKGGKEFTATESSRSMKDMALKVSNHDRKVSDVCLMSIFNIHVFCRRCGLSVCMACFNDRLNEVQYEESNTIFDKYKRILYGITVQPNHHLTVIYLCYFHEDLHPSKINDSEKILVVRQRRDLFVCIFFDKCLPDVKHFSNNGNLMVWEEPKKEGSIGHFRKHWRNPHHGEFVLYRCFIQDGG